MPWHIHGAQYWISDKQPGPREVSTSFAKPPGHLILAIGPCVHAAVWHLDVHCLPAGRLCPADSRCPCIFFAERLLHCRCSRLGLRAAARLQRFAA